MTNTHKGCQSGERHVFRVMTLDTLRIILQDGEGGVFAGLPYQFVFDGVAEEKKTTDSKGMAEAIAPDDVSEASLTVWPDEQDETLKWEWPLAVTPQTQALRIALEDDDGNPIGNVSYQFIIDGTEGERKETDEYGTASEDVACDAAEGKLLVWYGDPESTPPIELDLVLSSSMPVDINDHLRNRTRDLRTVT